MHVWENCSHLTEPSQWTQILLINANFMVRNNSNFCQNPPSFHQQELVILEWIQTSEAGVLVRVDPDPCLDLNFVPSVPVLCAWKSKLIRAHTFNFADSRQKNRPRYFVAFSRWNSDSNSISADARNSWEILARVAWPKLGKILYELHLILESENIFQTIIENRIHTSSYYRAGILF